MNYNKEKIDTYIKLHTTFDANTFNHPIDYYITGDEYDCVLAVSHIKKIIVSTSFYDMDDIKQGGDYEFIHLDDTLQCAYNQPNWYKENISLSQYKENLTRFDYDSSVNCLGELDSDSDDVNDRY